MRIITEAGQAIERPTDRRLRGLLAARICEIKGIKGSARPERSKARKSHRKGGHRKVAA